MDNCKYQEPIVEANNIDAQNCPRIPDTVEEVAGARGIDSSLLFFFLLLVVIVCESDCGIELDTLLWFFLLLVALFNFNDIL
jgi:hypothetical protein